MSVFLFSNVAVSLDVQCKKREHWVIIIIIVLSSSKNALRSIQPPVSKNGSSRQSRDRIRGTEGKE